MRVRPDPALLTPRRKLAVRVLEVSSPRDSPARELPPVEGEGNVQKRATPPRLILGNGHHISLSDDSSSAPERFYRPIKSKMHVVSPAPYHADESQSSEWSERSDSSNAEESEGEARVEARRRVRSESATLVPSEGTSSPPPQTKSGAGQNFSNYPSSPIMLDDDDDEYDSTGKHIPWQHVLARRQNSWNGRSRTASVRSAQSGSGISRQRPGSSSSTGASDRLSTSERHADSSAVRPMSPSFTVRSSTPDTIRDVPTRAIEAQLSTSPLKHG